MKSKVGSITSNLIFMHACITHSTNVYWLSTIYWVYTKIKWIICNFLSHYKIFPFLASSSEISVSIRGKKRQPTTFIILTLFSKWTVEKHKYFPNHTNTFSICFLFTLCAVNSFTLIKYLIEYLRVESLFFSLPLHFSNSLPLTLFLLFSNPL